MKEKQKKGVQNITFDRVLIGMCAAPVFAVWLMVVGIVAGLGGLIIELAKEGRTVSTYLQRLRSRE